MTTTTNPQTICDDFNATHGSVTWVRYWTGTRDDAPKYNLTDGKAWLLGGHTPVVRVRGESSCIALTHIDVLPGQPDDIDDDSHDLPDPTRAAARVREYISANGDGIYDVIDGHPLYARDLEALRRAVVSDVAKLASAQQAIRNLAQAYTDATGKPVCNCCFADGSTQRCGRPATTITDVPPYGPLDVHHTCKDRINGTQTTEKTKADDKPCCGYCDPVGVKS